MKGNRTYIADKETGKNLGYYYLEKIKNSSYVWDESASTYNAGDSAFVYRLTLYGTDKQDHTSGTLKALYMDIRETTGVNEFIEVSGIKPIKVILFSICAILGILAFAVGISFVAAGFLSLIN